MPMLMVSPELWVWAFIRMCRILLLISSSIVFVICVAQALAKKSVSPTFQHVIPSSYPSYPLRLIGFYFSVQSGGSFDIDYIVSDPKERILLEGTGERQGDYIFTANSVSLLV